MQTLEIGKHGILPVAGFAGPRWNARDAPRKSDVSMHRDDPNASTGGRFVIAECGRAHGAPGLETDSSRGRHGAVRKGEEAWTGIWKLAQLRGQDKRNGSPFGLTCCLHIEI